jgi:hypothetical protein
MAFHLFDEIAITACAISSGKLFRFQCNIFLLHPGTFSNIGSVLKQHRWFWFRQFVEIKVAPSIDGCLPLQFLPIPQYFCLQACHQRTQNCRFDKIVFEIPLLDKTILFVSDGVVPVYPKAIHQYLRQFLPLFLIW